MLPLFRVALLPRPALLAQGQPRLLALPPLAHRLLQGGAQGDVEQGVDGIVDGVDDEGDGWRGERGENGEREAGEVVAGVVGG